MQTEFNRLKMDIRLIKNEQDYQNALSRLDFIFDAPTGSAESDEADVLSLLVDDYENKHYPIEAPDPVEAIKIRMEEMQLKQRDIAPSLGGKNRASEILNRKRKLTIEMIRNLSEKLNLPVSLLIQDYKTSA
jgi:HTH-type transcriptional regulator/antitoxin HigA